MLQSLYKAREFRARAPLRLALAAAIAAAVIGPAKLPDKAMAQSAIEELDAAVRQVKVTRSKSRTFEVAKPFASAVVGSPDIADVLPMSDRILYVQGKKVGTTNVSVFDKNKRVIAILDVEVTIDARAVAERIRANIDSKGITVSSSQEQLILGGHAKNAVDAEQAVAIAKASAPELQLVNLIKVAGAQQVLLKVRFIEASRTAERDLGVNWFAANSAGTQGATIGLGSVGKAATDTFLPAFTSSGGSAAASPFAVGLANLASKGTNIDMLISALESKGLARRLAEPDLVALSGDTASFLAGGEVPVPVVQPSSGATPTITVDYKPFGVQLTFMPTVLANGVINLRLTPSVSELDYSNGISQNGFTIPALTKREARTTIELRDGQSFAIAGLLQTEGLRDISQVPWLGSVPVLGTMFRSSQYQQNETDLVVIVTPRLAVPATPGQKLATPLDGRQPSNDADFFLFGQTEVPKQYTEFVSSGGDISGPYGHSIPAPGK
ncbi:MAG: type II and III secretion system protein family protein [Rhodomicrobium sp.]